MTGSTEPYLPNKMILFELNCVKDWYPNHITGMSLISENSFLVNNWSYREGN